MFVIYVTIIFGLIAGSESISSDDALTVEQRREIFGTNSSVDLPPIELVTLQQVSPDQPRSYGKRPTNYLQYKLTRNGQEITLTLRQNTDFLSPGCFVHHHLRDGTVSMRPCANVATQNCFFSGRSDSHSGVWITANACQGLKGTISFSNVSYVIAPLHPKSIHDHDNGTHVHVVYRYRSEKKVCRTDPASEALQSTPLQIIHRGKREDQDTRYIDTRAVVDPSMFEFHQDKITDYVLTLFNIANGGFEDQSLGVKIRLVLSEIVIYRSYDSMDVEFTTDSVQTVTDMCRWLARNRTATNPDCNVLLTRLDIELNGNKVAVGMTHEQSGMCESGKNCVIVEDVGLAAGNVVAHEVGHLLGMIHDENTRCANSTGIMTIMASAGTSFSKCSAEQLQKFLDLPGAGCLKNEPAGLNNPMGVNTGRPLPGTIYTKDQQCKLFLGKQATYCKSEAIQDMDILCNQMRCKRQEGDEQGRDYSTRFADGTDCNNTRSWCISGRCVAIDPSVRAVNGGWSDWDADYSSCSTTCGGGVRLKRRTCTNPQPQYGGAPCVGDAYHGKMCNMQVCDRGYKETQCSELNGADDTWVPIPFTTGNNSCLFTCMSDGQVTNSSHFRDGTECTLSHDTPYGRCIDGICMAFGCDGVLGSGMMYDRCGICNGTGQGCNEVAGNYSTAAAAPGQYTTVQVIPRNSYWIKVTQHNSNCFLSAKMNGQRIFNTDPGNRHSNVYNVGGVTIKYNKFPETLDIRGPTTLDIEIQVYSYNISSPPQGHYEYRRVALDNQRILQYTWATTLSSCSKTCGTGTTTPRVQCVDFHRPVEDYLCSLSTKPNELERPCNTFACPASWKIQELAACSKTCGLGGIRTRKIYCAKENNGKEQILPSAVCHSDGSIKPASVVNCTFTPCPGVWKPGPWSVCSKTCSLGLQTREVGCYENMTASTPVDNKRCKHEKPPAKQQHCIKQSCVLDPHNCTDLENCDPYTYDVCFGYETWSSQHCRRFCGICSEYKGDDPKCSLLVAAGEDVCAADPDWSLIHCRVYCSSRNDTECRDIADCEAFRKSAEPDDMCRSANYTTFVHQKCRQFCNLCGGTSKGYVASTRATTQPTTTTPSPCVDKNPNCAGYTKSPCHDPHYGQFMSENCAKFCGFC